MTKQIMAYAILLAGLSAAAMADESASPPPSAYRTVLDAQYAARQQPMPARPEEAQRIYENYLQSIGKPARSSSNQEMNTATPSR